MYGTGIRTPRTGRKGQWASRLPPTVSLRLLGQGQDKTRQNGGKPGRAIKPGIKPICYWNDRRPIRPSAIARTSPQRERLASCPDVPALYPGKIETETQRLEKEEKLAIEELGKHLSIVENSVKDARNIHKQIQDAIVAAVIYYQRLRDARDAQEKDKATLSDSCGASNSRNATPNIKNQTTQTEEVASSGDTLRIKKPPLLESRTTQTEMVVAQSYPRDKKRIASSSPETPNQEKRVRTTPKTVEKTKPEGPSGSNNTDLDWETAEHRRMKRKKEDAPKIQARVN